VSSRQTNEELWLLHRLAVKIGALSDTVPHISDGDRLLLNSDRTPNKAGARLTGICAMGAGIKIPLIAESIRTGKIKTLIVFGEDVTKHGIAAELLLKLDTLIVSDISQNETTKRAHFALPACAHVEKRGTFTNTKGRVQKFMKAIEPPGEARAEWDFLNELIGELTGQAGPKTVEGLFNAMAQEVPAFNGLTWAALGDTGATAKI
jgi:predicted molibdopterin-dependent oxidoreductase YjgC